MAILITLVGFFHTPVLVGSYLESEYVVVPEKSTSRYHLVILKNSLLLL